MKRLLTVLFVLLILGSSVNLFSQSFNISQYAEIYLQNDLQLESGLRMTRNGRVDVTMGSCIYRKGDYLESYGLKGKVKSVKQKFIRANADISYTEDYNLRDMDFYPNGRMKEVYYKFNNIYYVLIKSVFDGDSLIEVHEDWYNCVQMFVRKIVLLIMYFTSYPLGKITL